jgi:hypothetical protein
VRDEAVDEVHDLGSERNRLALELRDGFGKAVRELYVSAAQLSQELHLVVARNTECSPGRDEAHRDPQNADNVRPAIHKVAEEDDLAALWVSPGRKIVAQSLEQVLELEAAAMDVADDVERPALVPAVVPQGLALDRRKGDLVRRGQDEHVTKPFALERAKRLTQLRSMPANDVRPERTTRPSLIALVTDSLGHVEHDGHR